MKKLILSALFAIFSIVSADTINSVSKNPSMAVLGTQRDSATVINPYVIPIAVSGAACNSTTDIVAVTSDHSSQLICQSGVWQPVGGGSDIASKTNPGYTRLPSGLIIQWGYRGSAGTTTITFPISFTTACFSVQQTGTSNWGIAYSCGKTSFVLSNGGSAAYWIAIGH